MLTLDFLNFYKQETYSYRLKWLYYGFITGLIDNILYKVMILHTPV